MDKKRHRLHLDVKVLHETEDGAATAAQVDYQGNPMILGSVLGSLMVERKEFARTIHVAVMTYLDEKLDDLEGDLGKFLKEDKLHEKQDTVN